MPDFGIFRGFNEKLFGDKLYAGQLPINLGMIASDFVDPDALAFFARVTTAGGTLSATEQTAILTLVKQMKLDGIWTKMKAIYPMVGASAAACAQNLKSSSFTGTFNGGWTFASTHIVGNGTNAFMDTTIIPTLSENLDWSMGVYMRTNTGGGSNSGFGIAIGSTNNLVRYYIGPRWTGFSNVSNFTIGQGANEINAAGPNAAGLFHGSRTANNAISSRRNNTSLGSNTTLMTAVATDKSIYVGGSNNNGFLGFPINDQMNFVYFGSGLTNGEMDNFYSAIQTMNTTLSRQV
jgi:hypothetical protein